MGPDRAGRPAVRAFPWAGGQALARHVLDHPESCADAVLDAASGSGLVAIAAANARAARVTACDVDPNAVAAIGINAHANGAAAVVAPSSISPPVTRLARRLSSPWMSSTSASSQSSRCGSARCGRLGAEVFVADPGRAFLPASALTSLASYEVPVLPSSRIGPSRRSPSTFPSGRRE